MSIYFIQHGKVSEITDKKENFRSNRIERSVQSLARLLYMVSFAHMDVFLKQNTNEVCLVMKCSDKNGQCRDDLYDHIHRAAIGTTCGTNKVGISSSRRSGE